MYRQPMALAIQDPKLTIQHHNVNKYITTMFLFYSQAFIRKPHAHGNVANHQYDAIANIYIFAIHWQAAEWGVLVSMKRLSYSESVRAKK